MNGPVSLEPTKQAKTLARRLSKSREIGPKLKSVQFAATVGRRALALLEDYGVEPNTIAVNLARRAVWWTTIGQMARKMIEERDSPFIEEKGEHRFVKMLHELRLAEQHLDVITDRIVVESRRCPKEIKEVSLVERLSSSVKKNGKGKGENVGRPLGEVDGYLGIEIPGAVDG